MANNRIQIKRTSVSGRAANTTTLPNPGELALNMTDGILYSSNGSVVFEIGANNTNVNVSSVLTVSGVTTVNSTGITTTGILTANGIVSGNELTSTFASGDEGGQINLAKPPNANTSGGIVIDAYQNKLRIYENGGGFRGAYIDLTAAANGVGTNLLGGGGGTGTVTSVGSGDGLTGGPITASGTLSVLANTGIIANAAGIFVNSSYIATLTANNANNLGGIAAANYVQNTDSRTLSGNLVFSGANVAFTNRIRISGGLLANNSLGTAGQILASNGTSVYWTSDQGANAITANSLSANFISVATGTITVGNSTVNTDIGNNYISVGNSTSFANVYSTFIRIGNSTVTSTINSTSFTGTANNASNLGGNAAANFVQNTDSRTLSGNLYFTGANNNFSGNLTIEATGELIITSGAGIIANGTLGTANQVLTTNGTTVYWANAASGGGFSNGQSISVNNFVVTGSFTANGSTGSAGQFLISSGSGVYWASTGNATSQSFTGNGSNTVFSLSQSISDQNNILITLDGLVQIPNTHYSISGNTLTFTDAPLSNTVIEARTLGAGVGGGGGGGATGGGSDQIFYQNDTTITTDYTISTNKNAMTAGPITINTGVTITVPSGSVWTIV